MTFHECIHQSWILYVVVRRQLIAGTVAKFGSQEINREKCTPIRDVRSDKDTDNGI